MYSHEDKVLQSRLAVHAIEYEFQYVENIPWFRNENEKAWVTVASTLKIPTVTLKGNTLRAAVESAFLHNLKAIPTEIEEQVETHNCELYTDSSGTVGIAYALKSSNVLFHLLFCPKVGE